jgi:uncharacterized protein YcaQ
VNCKAYGKDGSLEIKSLYFEQHASEEESVIAACVNAVDKFCQFHGCHSVSLTQAQPKGLTRSLRNALKPLG